MHLKLVAITHESSSFQVFHSFYKEMESKFSISAKAKNLFLSLAESIAQTLSVTSCYVCGGINMENQWAWKKDDKWPPE
jgi:heterodisulfide reductase subunit B